MGNKNKQTNATLHQGLLFLLLPYDSVGTNRAQARGQGGPPMTDRVKLILFNIYEQPLLDKIDTLGKADRKAEQNSVERNWTYPIPYFS